LLIIASRPGGDKARVCLSHSASSLWDHGASNDNARDFDNAVNSSVLEMTVSCLFFVDAFPFCEIGANKAQTIWSSGFSHGMSGTGFDLKKTLATAVRP